MGWFLIHISTEFLSSRGYPSLICLFFGLGLWLLLIPASRHHLTEDGVGLCSNWRVKSLKKNLKSVHIPSYSNCLEHMDFALRAVVPGVYGSFFKRGYFRGKDDQWLSDLDHFVLIPAIPNLRRKSAMHGIGIAGIPNHGAWQTLPMTDRLTNQQKPVGGKNGRGLKCLKCVLSDNKRVWSDPKLII